MGVKRHGTYGKWHVQIIGVKQEQEGKTRFLKSQDGHTQGNRWTVVGFFEKTQLVSVLE